MGRRSIFYVPALLILILFPMVLVVLVTSKLAFAGGNSDPFAPFAALPGQPSTRMSQYPCQFDMGPQQAVEPTRCHILPEGGSFLEVTILFYRGYRISEVILRPESILVGDLLQRWGMPLAVDNHSSLFMQLRWRRETAFVIVPHRQQRDRLSYWLPVYSIFLSEEELSIPEISPTASTLVPE